MCVGKKVQEYVQNVKKVYTGKVGRLPLLLGLG